MIAVGPELGALLGAGLWQLAVVFLRVSALVSVLPAFGERTVPVRVKLVIAIAFTTIVTPAIGAIPTVDGPVELSRFVATEAVIGLAFGMGIRLFVLALQTAGSIAAQSTSLSQILGGAAVEPVPAMGYVLVIGGLALAVMTGLHVQVARFLIVTYDVFPPGQFPDGSDLSRWGVSRVAHAFSLAFMLAGPFIIASVVYNLAMGAVNRAMPQLMVAFVGAPAITMGGLFLLFAGTPLILSVWVDALGTFFLNPSAAPP